MADEDQRDAPSTEGGVFGKLPSVRPGMRSPRRHGGKAKTRPAGPPEDPGHQQERAGAAGAVHADTPSPATASPGVHRTDAMGRGSPSPPPTPPGPRAPVGPGREPEASEGAEAPGVEDLAWAGITVAAEAATLGVRLLSRAVEVLRKPADNP